MDLLGNEDEVQVTVNGRAYKQAYHLGNGMYPNWRTIVKLPRDQEALAAKIFASAQQGARKDIGQPFGVIHIWFAVTWMPCCMWYLVDMHSDRM